MSPIHIPLTKQELKKQKDQLKRFQRYLPTLILKMQQLKVHLNRVETKLHAKQEEQQRYLQQEKVWQGVFGDNLQVEQYVQIDNAHITHENLAGLMLPSFVCLNFEERRWDLYALPLWVDSAVTHLKARISLEAEIRVMEEQRRQIAEELTSTTQRVNLFEKIRIPETIAAIRRIKIYLGDYYTAAVVRGKIAKQKLERGRA